MKSRSVVFVALALGAAMSAGIVTAASGSRDLVTQRLVSLNRVAASVIRTSSLLQVVEGPSDLSMGSDGRLTVLLLGSDSRGGGVGLTDTIMVFSLREGSISALSIPRDTARIPNPEGGTFPGRINALLQKLRNGRTLDEALAAFERVIEHLLHVEIDHHALIGFSGFQALVKEVEPVSLDIHREIRDSKFWDDPRNASGVYFPVRDGYDLFALQPGADSRLCDGRWRSAEPPVAQQFWCRRAMPFVRSRKGRGNSDFARARRQQDFVVAAIRRVIKRGSGGALSSLVDRAKGQADGGSLTTNIPIKLSTALDLYDLMSAAKLDFSVVLGPPTYSTHIPGGTSYELDMAAVRRVTRDWFGGSAAPFPTATEPASQPGSPSSSPTAPASPTPTRTSTGMAPPTVLPAPTAFPSPSSIGSPAPTPPGVVQLPGYAAAGLLVIAGLTVAGALFGRIRRRRRP